LLIQPTVKKGDGSVCRLKWRKGEKGRKKEEERKRTTLPSFQQERKREKGRKIPHPILRLPLTGAQIIANHQSQKRIKGGEGAFYVSRRQKNAQKRKTGGRDFFPVSLTGQSKKGRGEHVST